MVLVKKLLAVVLFMLFGFSLSPTHAQTETWWAWTYTQTNGEMVLIDSIGTIRKTVILPKPPSTESYQLGYSAVVAPTGDRVAYNLFGENGATVITVYHLMNDTTMLTYFLPSPPVVGEFSPSYSLSDMVFSADGRYLAFSYFADADWTLLVLDTLSNTTNVVFTSLDRAAPNAPQIDDYLVPIPLFFDVTDVHFIASPMGDGFDNFDSYVWDITTGNVALTNLFRSFGADVERRTGEIIYPYRDTRFTDRTAEIMGMGVHTNTIQVYSPAVGSGVFPFYVEENNVLYTVDFIQNSDLILIGVGGFDGVTPVRYRVIDRAGGFRGQLLYAGLWMNTVFGVGEGFIFTANSSELLPYFPFLANTETASIVFVDTASQGVENNVGRVVYTGSNGSFPRVVWVRDVTNPPVPLTSTWAQVPVPPVSNNPPANNNLPPANLVDSGLYVGALARVTLDGDGLNVRTAPSTSATILTQLPMTVLATILDGPQYADGFTWWQISGAGVTGWVAEGNSSELWLELAPTNSSNTLPPPPPPVVSPLVLPAPTLYEPAAGQNYTFADLNSNGTTLPVGFEWVGVEGGNRYFMQLEKCDPGGVCYYVYGSYADFPFVSFDITPYGFGQYRWRAVAYNAQFVEGIYSEWVYFNYVP
jgi:hypothetical protein